MQHVSINYFFFLHKFKHYLLYIVPIIGEENRRQNRQDTNIVPLESISLSTTTNTIFPSTNYQNENIDLPKPELLNQPKRLWHAKYLAGGVTRPLVNLQVEGLGQRSRLQIKVNEELLKLILFIHNYFSLNKYLMSILVNSI
jgi:hypothetical protein